MPSLFKFFADRWNNWVGDRDMEIAIRRHLTENGFYGNTAKLRNVRLIAVQRPGWLQVFRFEASVRVKPDDRDDPDQEIDSSDLPIEPVYRDLFGLIREDARKNQTDIRVFQDARQRRELFGRWSEDLICLRGAQGLAER